MKVRVGIRGCGFIGRIQALDGKSDSRVALVGVADTLPQAAQRLATEVNTNPLPSLEALLDAGIEALYVCTPNTLHLEPVLRGLAASVHVFSEKPMATSLADAWKIREAARRARRIYQLGFNRRFANVYRFAKQMIDEGRITPLLAQMKHNRGELKQPPWTADASVTGGYRSGKPLHHFDMSRFLLGAVVELPGWGRRSGAAELDGLEGLLGSAGAAGAS